METQANFLLRFLEKLHLDIENIHLVGHSMGATIVLEAIRQAGTSPRSLCLLAPLEYGISNVPFSARPFASFPTWLLEAGTRVGLNQFLLVHQMLRLLHNPNQLTREYVDELARFLRRPTSVRVLERGVMASINRGGGSAPKPEWVKEKRSIYSKIRCPSSLLWGTNDLLIDPKAAQPIKSSIGQLEYSSIPDAGHILQLDVPLVVAALIERTWSRA